MSISHWCNLTLVRRLWATKWCLWASKICKTCQFGRPTGRATSLKANFELYCKYTLIKWYQFLWCNTAWATFLSVWPHISGVRLFFSKSCNIMLEHRVNNKSSRVKGRHWRWLIYCLRNFLLHDNMLRVSRSNHPFSWKFHKFYRKKPVLESLFFLKIMKLYKDICSAWISHTFAQTFSS